MATRIWKFLGSIRLAITLLIVLTVVSIVGIVIPQGLAPHSYIGKWGSSWGKAILTVGIDRMFSTTWFYVLLGFLALNITICSISRLLRSLRDSFRHTYLQGPEALQRFKHATSFSAPGDQATLTATVMHHLRGRLYSCSVKRGDGGVEICAKKGAARVVGSLTFHLCIILLFVGGFVGKKTGYSYLQNIRKGQVEPVRGRDFLLRCDWFKLEKNKQGAVKDYKSKLTLLSSDSAEIVAKVIEVNHPLSYRGIRFYQNSYSRDAESVESLNLMIRSADRGSLGSFCTVPFDSAVVLPKLDLTLRATRFLCDFMIDMRTRHASARSAEHNNPAARIVLTRGQDTLYNRWTFQKYPNMHKGQSDYEVVFLDYTPSFATGITVRNNPGVPFVWAGIILMTASIMLMFYTSRKTLWVFVEPAETGTARISMGGTSSRGPGAFQAEFDHTCDRLRSALQKAAPVSVQSGKETG